MNIELYNAGTEQAQVISLLLQAKGLDPTLYPYDCELSQHLGEPEPVLVDHGHAVTGALVISLYLEQRYPAPNLIPQNPQEASIILMLYRQCLKAPEIIQFREYREHLSAFDYIAGGRSSLVDVAISALAPDEPFWQRYRQRLLESWGSFSE